jgi:hypothetical protein
MDAKLALVEEIEVLPHEYGSVLELISLKIREARSRAMKAVNLALVEIYRDIGKTIHEKQEAVG